MNGETRTDISYREAGILLGWTVGILLISVLLWVFTQDIRDRQLLRTVNKVLVAQKREFRLGAPLPSRGRPGGVVQLGQRFSVIDKNDVGVVFVFIYRGIPASCLALLSPSGKVGEIVPLNRHGELMFERASPQTIAAYTRRIEAAERGHTEESR